MTSPASMSKILDTTLSYHQHSIVFVHLHPFLRHIISVKKSAPSTVCQNSDLGLSKYFTVAPFGWLRYHLPREVFLHDGFSSHSFRMVKA